MSDLFTTTMIRFFGLLTAVVIIVLAFVVYDEVTSDKFELRKDQWECTASHQVVKLVGKVVTIQEVCDRWERV